MPIYEYLCRGCRKRTSQLVLSLNHPPLKACRHCGSTELERLMSRFAAPRSEEARLESLADPSNLAGVDENDPASVARLMKRMGQEMGEDVGEDMEEALESRDGEGESDVADL